MDLGGQVALVTAAGRGIGRGIAESLAEAGASLVINSYSESTVKETAQRCEAKGARVEVCIGDITDRDKMIEMREQALSAFGKIDILIANAGILRDKSFKNMTDDMWDVVMDVHLRGTYLTTKVALDQMLEQGTGGRIIMTSSTSGLLGNFGQTNYGAAKAGIAGFMRCLWLEGVKYGITVNVLAPTATSRLTTDILPEEVQENFPPEAVSPAVVWLCTDEAKDISGRQWLVAGNNVSLLSWQLTPIAQASADAEPWAVADIGEKILASKDQWPPVNPLRGG